MGPSVDAGADAAEPLPARRLVLESASPLTLAFQASAEVRVRYEGPEGPIAGEVVTFALVGSAQDSTLSALAARTDEDGVATVELIGGSVVAAFQVRATAARAAPAYTDVAVSDAGFGSVFVAAPYAGRRGVTRATVAAYESRSCDRLLTADPATLGEPSRQRDLGTTDATAEFAALPSGVRYGLLARGFGPTGVELARGCADRVEVASGEETRVDVLWDDLPLRPEGGFAVSLRILALGRSQSARQRVRSAVGSAIADWGGDASMFLNEVLADVEVRDPAGAESLRATLAASTLTSDLAVRLAGASAGPWRVASELADATATVLSAPTLHGTLSFAARRGRNVDGLLVLAGLSASTPRSADVELAAADLVTPTTLAVAGTLQSEDHLDLDWVELEVPPGALTRRALAAELGVTDELAVPRLVERAIDCGTFAAWVRTAEPVAALCSDSCAIAACGRISSALASRIDAELGQLDEQAATLRMVGSVTLIDTTGDLLPNSVAADGWPGYWGGDEESRVTVVVAGDSEAP